MARSIATTPRPTSACRHRGGQPRPFARDRGVDPQRLECGLDDAEALSAARALVEIAVDDDVEVQLRR